MEKDPLDSLSAQLFAAAREEAPPAGAEARAVAAVRRQASGEPAAGVLVRGVFGSKAWLLAAVVASVAIAFGFVWFGAEPEHASIRPEPSRPLPTSEPVVVSTPSAPPVPAIPAPAKAAKGGAENASVKNSPATLSDELEALKVAQTALSASDAPGALRALDRYDRVLRGQKLRAEASLLRIEALSAAGQAEAASKLASRFVEENPNSPLVDRARTFIKQ
ncbi:MAG: hypothetical protein SFV15_23745 [Polyangiaceae bacterium]|nr:hypothetical protein [Polyangiaceae bacterium]